MALARKRSVSRYASTPDGDPDAGTCKSNQKVQRTNAGTVCDQTSKSQSV